MEKTIDIEKILTSKLGGKARLVPRCLINWLRKIAHEDQVNQFLYDHRDEVGTQWLTSTVEYLKMHITIEGEENLPSKDDGKLYTFVSNHPLGGQDGVALGSIIGRHYDGRFRYLVNDLLMNLPGLRPVCVGINKTGKQSRDFPRMVEAAFQGNDHIIMFPAGLNSRMTDGVIRDLPWKKTFVTKSVQCQRDIVPIHFSGRNSDRFYRIANWQKRLHLKVNLAMLFLVDEMYRNVDKDFTVKIGKPIPWQTFDRSRSAKDWALWVEDQVYAL